MLVLGIFMKIGQFGSKKAAKYESKFQQREALEAKSRQDELAYLHGPYSRSYLSPGNTTTNLFNGLMLMASLVALAEAVNNQPPELTRAERRGHKGKALGFQSIVGKDSPTTSGKIPAGILTGKIKPESLKKSELEAVTATRLNVEIANDQIGFLQAFLEEDPHFYHMFPVPLWLNAALDGKINILKLLYDKREACKIDVYGKVPNDYPQHLVGKDALALACVDGNIDVITFLLQDAEFLKRHKKHTQHNFVLVAAQHSKEEVLDFLVQQHIDLDQAAANPPTFLALIHFEGDGRLGIFKRLLDHGSNPNCKFLGKPLLVETVQTPNSYAEMEHLLKKKPDLYATDTGGMQAIEYAYVREDYRMIALFVEHGYDIYKVCKRKINGFDITCDFIDFVTVYDREIGRAEHPVQQFEQYSQTREMAEQIPQRVKTFRAFPEKSAEVEKLERQDAAHETNTVPVTIAPKQRDYTPVIMGVVLAGSAVLLAECGGRFWKKKNDIEFIKNRCATIVKNFGSIINMGAKITTTIDKDLVTLQVDLPLGEKINIVVDGKAHSIKRDKLKRIFAETIKKLFKAELLEDKFVFYRKDLPRQTNFDEFIHQIRQLCRQAEKVEEKVKLSSEGKKPAQKIEENIQTIRKNTQEIVNALNKILEGEMLGLSKDEKKAEIICLRNVQSVLVELNDRQSEIIKIETFLQLVVRKIGAIGCGASYTDKSIRVTSTSEVQFDPDTLAKLINAIQKDIRAGKLEFKSGKPNSSNAPVAVLRM